MFADVLKVGGVYTDGDFLVRPRPQKDGDYIISVVFKGKPTHHLATPNESGELVVNKTTFGQNTIEGLVKKLAKKQPGWPAPLEKPCAPKTRVQQTPQEQREIQVQSKDKPKVAAPNPSQPEPTPVVEPERTSTPPPPESVAKEPEVVPEPAVERAPTPPPPAVERAATPPPAAEVGVTPPATPPPPTRTARPMVVQDVDSPPLPPRQRGEPSRAMTGVHNTYAQRQVELNNLQGSSTTVPTLSLLSTPALTSTPTDGPELTYMLARAVLRLGTRVSAAEMQLQETRQLLHSLQSL